MADLDLGQPVRTELPGQTVATDLIVKVGDGTNPIQFLAIDATGRVTIKLDDGAGNSITSQANGGQRALDVGIAVGGVQIDPRLAGQYNSTLPTLTNGQFTAPQTDVNGRLIIVDSQDIFPATQNITAQDVASTPTAVFNQTWITGSPTAGSVANYVLSSNESVILQVSGTWTGTLTVEVSADAGTTWVAHSVHLLGSPIFTSSFTANVIGSINVAAKTNVRVRATAAWTGTATVKAVESVNSSSVYVANAIKLVDGSSPTSTTTATIKAASTAAQATDTAIVVSLSPNSPLPAGTSLIGSVNQGTSPWITSDLADGSVTGGTAGTKSLLGGGVFNTALPTLTTGQQAALQLDSSGRLIIRPLTSADVVTSRLQDGAGNAITSATAGSTRPLDVALRDGSGNLYTAANPVPVQLAPGESGTEKHDYNTASAIAAGATSNHDYSVTALKTFKATKFWASASGKMKIEVQSSPDGATFTSRWVGFNSTSCPNITIDLGQFTLSDTGTGAKIRIIRTNKETLVAQDLYSTISGVEV